MPLSAISESKNFFFLLYNKSGHAVRNDLYVQFPSLERLLPKFIKYISLPTWHTNAPPESSKLTFIILEGIRAPRATVPDDPSAFSSL